ncbi:hypothetical protein Ais01nite_57250 [Asanoa ishikariensis]|uniref:WD40-like Beta Propeller Repeat n=1 Tax=Asanoa ishikariensis TaxID=137265 RepID=A0A1H3TY39_9ACTN|nr:hypothetical protein [Asanoa ishikariensis]GIF67690.1 hypothetical protein Ais01nite_57250 [Asanoa ishikariensis]SDZ55143.1 hypothetical protein SAMN05421684_6587 [Asanoa ishikariensis]
MTGMRELLADVAAEARSYDVTDRALRIARRQRRVAWAAPVAAVVLVAAGAVAVLPLRPDKSAEVGWLPERLAPERSVVALPDTRVSPAVLAYTRGDGSTTLVTADGRHYDGGEAVRAISPDGRWVAMLRDGRRVVRDLGGDRVVDLGTDDDTNIVAWSRDSRWMAVRTGVTNPGAPQSVKVVELATGTEVAEVAAGAYGTTTVCGLRDSAYLLLCYAVAYSDEVSVSTVNPLDGSELGRDVVTMNRGLEDSQFAGGALLPDGHTLALWTENPAGATDDPRTFDLNQPGVRPRRHTLPVPKNEERALRQVETSVDGGALVTRRSGQDLRVTAVELLDFASDRVSTVTTVTGDIRDIVVRGQV